MNLNKSVLEAIKFLFPTILAILQDTDWKELLQRSENKLTKRKSTEVCYSFQLSTILTFPAYMQIPMQTKTMVLFYLD